MSEKLVAVKLFLQEQGYEIETPWNQQLTFSSRDDLHITVDDEREMMIAVWMSDGEFRVKKDKSWHYRYDASQAVRIDLHDPESLPRLARLVKTGLIEDGDEILKDRAGPGSINCWNKYTS